jgi:hypothetical protein
MFQQVKQLVNDAFMMQMSLFLALSAAEFGKNGDWPRFGGPLAAA